MRHEEVSGI